MATLKQTHKTILIMSGCLVATTGAFPALADHNLHHLIEDVPTIQFKPSPKAPKPDRTSGAGSRKDFLCPQDAPPLPSRDSTSRLPSLVALVPQNHAGLTLAARPPFWIYLPKTAAKQLVLSLREENGTIHSQSFVPIPEASGIVRLDLPADASPLAVNKTYQWAVVLMCGERPSPNDPVMTASIRRVSVPQPPTLEGSSALQQANWYSQNGLWYDAIASLANLKQSSPHDPAIARVWSQFLYSAGLQALSAEPLIAAR
jgi:hypothetical protein